MTWDWATKIVSICWLRGLRIWISNRFPGDVDASDQRTTELVWNWTFCEQNTLYFFNPLRTFVFTLLLVKCLAQEKCRSKFPHPNTRCTQWYWLWHDPIEWPSVKALPDWPAPSGTDCTDSAVGFSPVWFTRTRHILGHVYLAQGQRVDLQLWDHLILTVAERHRGEYESPFLYVFS